MNKLYIGLLISLNVLLSSAYAADYVQEAQSHLAKGEHRAAMIQLKNELKQKPDNAQARFLLGNIYLRQFQTAAAIKELGKAVRIEPNNINYQLNYSQALLMTKEYKKVIKTLSIKGLEFKPKSEQKNQRDVFIGYAHLGMKEMSLAKEKFKQAEQNNYPAAFTGLAKIAMMKRDYILTEQYLDKALANKSDDREASHLKAKIQNLTKKHDKAIPLYENLIKQYPSNKQYVIERASTYLALKKLDLAKKDIEAVLKENKKQPYANYLMAQVNLKQKDYKSARQAAQAVLNVSTHHSPSKLIMGISNYALGNLNQADKNLTEFLSTQPNNLAIQNLLANVYLAQKKPEQAILMLESIEQEKMGKSPAMMTTLGSAYLLMGQHQKGVELLNSAKTLAPDNLAVQKRLIAGQLQGGDKGNAIAGLEKVAKQEPENTKVHYLLLISYIQEKQIDKADAKLQQMFAQKSDDVLLYNFRSVIELIKGNKANAKQAYQDALNIDTKFIPALMGLAKFSFNEGDTNSAIDYFTQVTKVNKAYLASYLALASISEKNKQNDKAEEYLITAYKNNAKQLRNQLKVLGLLGKWYAKFKQPEKLLPLAKDLIKQYPDNIQALSFVAGSQMVNGKNREAQSTLKNIIARQPKDSKHRVLYANLLAKEEGREQEVLRVLEDVFEIDPNKSQALTFQVNYLIKQKSYKKAFEVTERIEMLFPSKATAKKLQGDILWVQNRKDKAINLYRQAYKKQPGVKSLFFLSELMVKEGKGNIAIQFLKDELADKPNNKAILLKLASTYQQLGDEVKAIVNYSKIIDLQNDNVLALNNLAWIYFKQNTRASIDKAAKLAQLAYNKAPKSPQVADTYAVILLEKLGEQRKALDILKVAANKAASDYDIQFHLAKAYDVNGNRDEAVKILRLITSSDKKFTEKESAKKLLGKLDF